MTESNFRLQRESAARLVRPPALRRGDRVGVFAPSFPTARWFPARYQRGLTALARELQVEVVESSQVGLETGFTSGDVRERAAALLGFVADPGIRAIFCSIGGFNSAELLPLLEPDMLRRDPKILVGYSDCTALLLGVHALGGWCTFHGPAVMTQFGEYPNPHAYTLRELRRVTGDVEAAGAIEDPDGWTNEFLDWGTDAWLSRPRQMWPGAAREIWRPGHGTGVLWGGNIETLNFLIGTPYLAVPDDIVLFWEATEEEALVPRVRRALVHLAQAGILDRTRAMLVGRCPDAKPFRGVSLADTVVDATRSYGFPIVGNLPLGHTDPIMTLPIGVAARVVADGGTAAIGVLEPGVRHRDAAAATNGEMR